ncbi:MAG: hypothetical protein JSR29_12770 [Nitrospira sp.]|nr:hypothetical protein [Nitrospira sp.]
MTGGSADTHAGWEGTMNLIGEEIKRVVTCAAQTHPGLRMDDLILACTPYTWNQVLGAVNELIKDGTIIFRQRGRIYALSSSSEGDTLPSAPTLEQRVW